MNSPQNMSRKLASRNAPCSCGSGLKFKHCCLNKIPARASKRSSRIILGTVLAFAVVGIVVAVVTSNAPHNQDQLKKPIETGVAAPTSTPAAWYHDVVNNRHWHPDHGHWHDGPPPGASALTVSSNQDQPGNISNTGIAAPTSTPADWHYDEANNRHWHPDHGHWHDGPPPDAPAEVSATQ
jgi:hypothetical protein